MSQNGKPVSLLTIHGPSNIAGSALKEKAQQRATVAVATVTMH